MAPRLFLAIAFGSFILACGGGSEDVAPVEATEKSDAIALCLALTESGETDAETDAAISAAAVGTDWGRTTAAELVKGEGLQEPAMDVLVAKIRETGANEDSLDCALIEGFWGLGE
ncbi:MAG: hypothetical protein GY913_16135 [Proteobacteria bacterium]|nr:hypothetical protein [Pseudomonadota bacterium]MCP4918435.1 hypothetical protein [Pseudomonadota bacterium]